MLLNKLYKKIVLLLFCIITFTICTAQVPTNPTVSNITTTSAKFSWNPVAGAISYRVKWTSDAIWDSIATPTVTNYTATGLTSNKSYRFVVRVQTPSVGSYTAEIPFTTLSTGGSGTLPQFDHIVIVVEENHGYTQIVGNSSAPYFNGLINGTQSALFTQSYALTHPSQPNYIMLFSGSNQGVTNDNCPVGPFNTGNIFQQLGSIGKTYKSYNENLPSIGSTTCSSGSNGYRRKHNPWVNFSNVDHTKELPFTSFPTDFNTLPYLSYVIPNQLHDWHDGTLSQMDSWLNSSGLISYANWAKTHNSLLIVTFDEDNGSYNNRIATVFVGAKVLKGSYATTINHYSILRLLEDINSLPRLAGAASATSINFCWTTAAKLIEDHDPINIEVKVDSFDYRKAIYYEITGVRIYKEYAELPRNIVLIAVDTSTGIVRKIIITDY